ncbi:hypothetical protein B0H16DRAFT_1570844 [Mycena metata]|uniref:Uncharacterized protein n=1 Tax=Mycena metata TaxID=1033252 RepID=A0AAD7MY43_9AGAR|nr:hypothetical protein B0H16DRAFT_1570844 [Mycena metata]
MRHCVSENGILWHNGRSNTLLTKLCLIAVLTGDHDNQRLISVLALAPSLVEFCVQTRGMTELITIDELVSRLQPTTTSPQFLPRLEALTIGVYRFNHATALVDMLHARVHSDPHARVHSDPNIYSPLRSVRLFHCRIRLFWFSEDNKSRIRRLQAEGLEFVEVAGSAARQAMLSVPFFHADISDGQYWSPEKQSL